MYLYSTMTVLFSSLYLLVRPESHESSSSSKKPQSWRVTASTFKVQAATPTATTSTGTTSQSR